MAQGGGNAEGCSPFGWSVFLALGGGLLWDLQDGWQGGRQDDLGVAGDKCRASTPHGPCTPLPACAGQRGWSSGRMGPADPAVARMGPEDLLLRGSSGLPSTLSRMGGPCTPRTQVLLAPLGNITAGWAGRAGDRQVMELVDCKGVTLCCTHLR